MSKFNTGKASVLVLTAVLAVAAFLFGKSLTSVAARDDQNHDDCWGKCVSTGPQCGTDNGTQSKVSTENRDFHMVCPDGYKNNGDRDNCRKYIETTYKTVTRYADKIKVGCNRVCPTDSSAYTSTDSHKACSKQVQIVDVAGHYDYKDKVKAYEPCQNGWTLDPKDNSKCQKTETRDCHTGVVDNSACASPTPEPSSTPESSPTPEPSSTPVVTPTPTPTQSNNSNGGSSNSNPGAPVCNATKPGTPTIYSAVRVGNSEKLTWSAATNATYYSIVYGSAPGYQYGVANTGNITSYTVNGLSAGVTYHFAVNAVNDCMPGDLGIQAGTGTGGQVLGASTMAGTGTFDETFFQTIMSIGATLSAIGLRGLKKAKRTSKK